MKQLDVSLLLPVRNEEFLLKKTLTQICVYLESTSLKYELLVIINGTTDSSESIVRSFIKKNPNVKMLNSEDGYGQALRKGIECGQGKYVIIYNVDFFDLRFVDLVRVGLLGHQMVIGSKMAYWSMDKRPFSRHLISWLFNLFLLVFFRFKGSDTHGIKVAEKTSLDAVYKYCQTNSGIFDTELVLRYQRAGYSIMEVPVEVTEKRSSRFHSRLWVTLLDLWKLRLSLSRYPQPLLVGETEVSEKNYIERLVLQLKLYLPWILLLVSLILLFIPSFLLNYSLVDDGYSAEKAASIYQAVFSASGEEMISTLFERDIGRVRPAYLLLQSLLLWTSGLNPGITYLFRFITMILSLIFIIRILRLRQTNTFTAVLTVIYFAYNFQNYENYYRLGTSEPYLVLAILVLVYLVISGRVLNRKILYLGVGLSVFTSFIKETFFLSGLCFGVWGVYELYAHRQEKRWKQLFIIAGSMLASGLVLYLIKSTYPDIQTYTSAYDVNQEFLLAHWINYQQQILLLQTPFIYIVLIGLLRLCWDLWKNRLSSSRMAENIGITIFFGSLLVLHLLILLPWGYSLGRYLLLPNIGAVFLFVFGWSYAESVGIYWDKRLRLSKSLLLNVARLGFVFMVCFYFLPTNLIEVANYQLWQKTDSRFSNAVLTELSTLPRDSIVIVNYIKGTDNIEIYKGTYWHLKHFYGRPDLQFIYLEDVPACASEQRYILDRSSTRKIETETIASHSTLLASGSEEYAPLDRVQVLKSFSLAEKQTKWSTVHTYNWNLFAQNPGTCLSF